MHSDVFLQSLTSHRNSFRVHMLLHIPLLHPYILLISLEIFFVLLVIIIPTEQTCICPCTDWLSNGLWSSFSPYSVLLVSRWRSDFRWEIVFICLSASSLERSWQTSEGKSFLSLWRETPLTQWLSFSHLHTDRTCLLLLRVSRVVCTQENDWC